MLPHELLRFTYVMKVDILIQETFFKSFIRKIYLLKNYIHSISVHLKTGDIHH